MPLSPSRFSAPNPLWHLPAAGLDRDVMWDRPLFRPPLLESSRIRFDPLPFTATRPLPLANRARPASRRVA